MEVPKIMRTLDWEHLLGRTILHWLMFIALVGVPAVFGAAVGQQENSIALAGTWRFRLDPDNTGIEKKWFAEKLDDSVTLPGTTARPIILDETPANYRPIIHVIDNFARNHKLGLLFETKVGQGKLLVCASDLPALQAHPEARQLTHSLLRYVASPAFAPRSELDAGLLKILLPGEIQGNTAYLIMGERQRINFLSIAKAKAYNIKP
jgi:hypothetical protein